MQKVIQNVGGEEQEIIVDEVKNIEEIKKQAEKKEEELKKSAFNLSEYIDKQKAKHPKKLRKIKSKDKNIRHRIKRQNEKIRKYNMGQILFMQRKQLIKTRVLRIETKQKGLKPEIRPQEELSLTP